MTPELLPMRTSLKENLHKALENQPICSVARAIWAPWWDVAEHLVVIWTGAFCFMILLSLFNGCS